MKIDVEKYNSMRHEYGMNTGSVDDIVDCLTVDIFSVEGHSEVLLVLKCPFSEEKPPWCGYELSEMAVDIDEIEEMSDIMLLSTAGHMSTEHHEMSVD